MEDGDSRLKEEREDVLNTRERLPPQGQPVGERAQKNGLGVEDVS